MIPPLKDYFELLATLHDGLKRALEGLPQEALDWSPGPGMNSLAVLAVHTAGSQRYWIGDIAGRDPSGRDRDAEFRTAGVGAGELVDRLDRALAHSRAVIEQLDAAALEEPRVSRGGEQITVFWCLAHALEHTALHLGHMEITRQLWEQTKARTDNRQ